MAEVCKMEEKKFPCDKCTMCCRHLEMYEPAKYLDRGDGVCKYLNEQTHLCSIYESRPDFCDVRMYFEKEYKNKMSWDEFIEYMKVGCKELQENEKYKK